MQSYLIKSALSVIAATAVTSCSSVSSSNSLVDASTAAPKKTVTKVVTPKPTTKAKPKTVAKKSVSTKIGKDKHGMSTYSDSSRSRYVRATAYSHMEREPGAPGRKNAAGTILKYGSTRSAAADWSRLPLGTKFRVKGQPGITYIVDDYGSALVGTNTVDFFFPTLRQMRNWGTRKVTIDIIEMGSFSKSAKLLKGRQHASHCRKMYYAIKKKLNTGSYAKN